MATRHGPNTGRTFDTIWRRHLSESHKRYFADFTARKRASDIATLLWQTPQYRDKMLRERRLRRKHRVWSGRYYRILQPGHLRADVNGYVAEHILIAESSLMRGRPLNPQEVVHHIDGNKRNNDPKNLVILTRQAHSSHHAKETGLHRYGLAARRVRRTNCKLTDAQVIEIRRRYGIGNISQAQLGRDYGLSQRTIYDIVSGKNWKHLL